MDHVDFEYNLLVIIGEGELQLSELMSLWDELCERPDWSQVTRVLFDLTRCSASLHWNDVSALVDLERKSASLLSGKRVALASGVPVTFGISRMLEMRGEYSRNHEVATCSSLAEAYAWLVDGAPSEASRVVSKGREPGHERSG